MDLVKIQQLLSIIGGIVIGLPVLLHSIRQFLLLIPGEQGETFVGKLEEYSQKLADMIGKFFPQPKPQDPEPPKPQQ